MKLIVPGTFDLTHKGHEELFSFAKELTKDFIILINGDSILKGRKETVEKQEDRAGKVSRYAPVMVANSREEWLKFVKFYSPCFVLHGNDWDITGLSKLYGVQESWWRENNIYLIYKDRYPRVSSTQRRGELIGR